MTWLKRIVLALFVLFLLAQFVRPERTNPPVDPADELRAPAHVQQILDRSCKDCHSHRSHWPWYSNITPANWFLVDHVNEGRRELNFSTFRSLSPKDVERKMDEICEEVEEGHMPLPEYLWLHRDARLSEADKQMLCEWAELEERRIKRAR
jgi:Haem-binding domain